MNLKHACCLSATMFIYTFLFSQASHIYCFFQWLLVLFCMSKLKCKSAELQTTSAYAIKLRCFCLIYLRYYLFIIIAIYDKRDVRVHFAVLLSFTIVL